MLGVYSESGDELELTSDPVEIALITYTSCLQKNICPKLLFLLQENGFAFLQCLCKKATPGTILETYFTKNDGSLLHLYLCLLPDCEPSRHAGYGHPYTIYELLKKVKTTSSTLLVFLILRDPQKETFAACCAVSRAFPLYTLSSSKSNYVESLEVDLKIFISSSVSSHSSDDILLVCRNIRNTARLVDMPPNVLNPATYQKFIREWVEGLPGVTIEVLEGEELRARGLGGLYSVGKASADPPALVILSYSHASAAKPVCLVGKGITFDTGGLSLKTRTGMCGMKMDMGGSAGAFVSLVESGKLKTSLHCLLCIAENSVSSKATRPDDVHLLYSGKSVEVNNPDAEGRLVLADGLAYAAKRYAPGLLVDIATLTGAQGTATGNKHAAIYASSEKIETIAVESGKVSGDLCHPLPYAPEFLLPEFHSAVADMKNSQKNRDNAGCAAPAVFLSIHIEDYLKKHDTHWLHIDIASLCMRDERATGFGVALLFHVVMAYMKETGE